MAEYIEREAVKAEFKKNFAYGQNENFAKWLERVACEIVDKIPVADVQPVVRWISVDEALPENDADCLVWYKCDTAFGKSESWGIAHCSRCDWYTKYLNGDNIVVLYWQPLPEPPEAIKG